CACAARYASAFACHAGVSCIGGFGGMCRLLRQSTSQTPLQSGSLASAAHGCVAASTVGCGGGGGCAHPATTTPPAAATKCLPMRAMLRLPRLETVQEKRRAPHSS